MSKGFKKNLATVPSKVRIIGGTWRSRLIDVPTVPGSISLRPTPDRVRETLFNWLGQTLDGRRCLDLFAGTGALGFEAASRGATEVVMVENFPPVFKQLQQSAALLKADNVRLVRSDALIWLQNELQNERQNNAQGFDVIFLDPPYHQGWLDKLAPLLTGILEPHGRVYAEAEHPVAQLGTDSNALKCIKTGQAGQVHYQLFSFDTD